MSLITLPTAPAALAVSHDIAAVRADFPILQTRVNGKPLAYLDNAASSQKPTGVIETRATY